MKMPSDIAAWFQFKLYLLTLSGYSADSFVFTNYEKLGSDLKYRWQLAVDMIYRGIRCDLMSVWDGPKLRSLGEPTLLIVKELAQFEPSIDNFAMCWVGPEIEATELCENLINEFDIENFEVGEICTPFIDEIERLFERNGVSWREAPLIELRSGVRKN